MSKHLAFVLAVLFLAACGEGAVVSVNTPPTASMTFPPPEGAQAFETTPVVLRGVVRDGGSAGEPDLEFTFLSDRDGELGSGTSGEAGEAEIEAVTLTVGLHVITLQVTDRLGASGSASAELEIVPNAAPVLTVTTEEGAIFLEGEPVILEGTVADGDHEVFSLTMEATSDTLEVGSPPEVNGDGFDGEWFVVFNGVEVGEHAAVLRATDPLGKSGSVVATFRVDACTDDDGDGFTECTGDCNDGDVQIAPGRPEICNGIDDDCDGSLGASETDDDGDGVAECDGDCDDTDDAVLPGADETCDGTDEDCDGALSAPELDLDADGVTECDGDCEPIAPSVYPGAPEICDNLDNNCDGLLGADELDDDADGWTPCNGDCDDADATAYPTAVEICDGVNNDCSGGLPPSEFDLDADGWMLCNGDCDEAAPATYPGAPEACDATDNDCDGVVPLDEIDDDGDAFTECQGDCDDANSSVFPFTVEVCDELDTDCDGTVPPSEDDADGDGWMVCEGDCDDAVAVAFPGATEVCNQVDDDCDSNVPSNEIDGDGDGYAPCEGDCDDGDASANLDDADGDGQDTCSGDCDDADAVTYSGAPEDACDGLDTDCVYDGDEVDDDGDGYKECEGDCDDTSDVVTPDDLDGDGYAGCADDCDDTDPLTSPEDYDGDGFSGCTGDCDETDPTIRPSSFDVCWDGVDTDCSGDGDLEIDDDGDGAAECEGDCDDTDAALNIADADGDGYSLCDGDCNDSDPDFFPGALETWDTNGDDRDCDGDGDDIDLASAWASWTGGVVGSRDRAGYGVAAGDVDDDGVPDLLIGAPDQGAGRAFLLYGSGLAPGHGSLAAADVSFTGEDSCDQAGIDVAVGDFDGDGAADVVVAAKERYCGQRAGKVHVLFGAGLPTSGSVDLGTADVTIQGEEFNDAEEGVRVAAGDLDGDGQDELIIGVEMNDDGGGSSGKAVVFFGDTLVASSSLVYSDADTVFVGAAGDRVGRSVAGSGDVDGDGLEDMLVGGDGETYLLYGATVLGGGTLDPTDADGIFSGTPSWSVAFAGDLDGDSLDEVLVSAGNGAYLMYGSTVVLGGTWQMQFADVVIPGSGLGTVASAGDVDGDGVPDLLIGSRLAAAPDANCSGDTVGATALVLGSSLPSTVASFIAEPGQNPGGGYGYSLASAGDIDGDGLADLLLGYPCWGTITGPLESGGKNYLFLSPY